MQIAFLGDSLTEGRPGAAYLPLLRERLPRHELLNLGRAGDTVVELLRRVSQRGLDSVAASMAAAIDALDSGKTAATSEGG